MEILKFHVNILQQYSAFTHLSPAMLSLLKDKSRNSKTNFTQNRYVESSW